jgi:hypothetical protein
VSHIFVSAQDRDTHGFDRADRRPHERQYQIEVVNHQIQDRANVLRAAGEESEPMAGDEFGAQWPCEQVLESWVESFDVADLEECALACSKRYEVLRFGRRCRQRFFHKNRDALVEKVGRDPVVMDGRCGDDGGIDVRQQGVAVNVCAGAAAQGDGRGLLCIDIRNADQFHVFEARENPRVFLAQVPDPDHTDP